jgi:hypothetical protein
VIGLQALKRMETLRTVTYSTKFTSMLPTLLGWFKSGSTPGCDNGDANYAVIQLGITKYNTAVYYDNGIAYTQVLPIR